MSAPYDEKPLSTADLAGTTEHRTPEPIDELSPDYPGPAGVDRPGPAGLSGTLERERPAPLFTEDEAGRFRARWLDVQAGFVDEPRRAVEAGDHLVAELMKRLAEIFAEERSQLEHQWDREGNVSTEDLRVAFQRYRSFFDRLLSV